MRGNVSRELRKLTSTALVDAELESLNLFKLLKAFERVMQRFEDASRARPVHRIARYSYTIQEQQDYIFSKVKKGKSIRFDELFLQLENRMHAIVTFLALLELVNMQMLFITQGLGINNFWVGDTPPVVQAEEEE